MGYKVVQRENITKNTRAYFTYSSICSFFLVNFFVNLIVWFFKAIFYVAFLPITLYISIIKRKKRGKVIFSIIWFIAWILLFALALLIG